MPRTPDGPPPPPVAQRLRLRYAKRGRLRFLSHRDIARAFERAIRRAGLPVAFSAGFTPHPKVSWLGAAPTGAASEAEYMEIGLAEPRDPAQVRAELDASLPAGLDVLECVPVGPGSLADRVDASRWEIRISGEAAGAGVADAVSRFLERDHVEVERRTKDGRRLVDAREAVVYAVAGLEDAHGAVGLAVAGKPRPPTPGESADCAILTCVVRHTTPAVRPDDVLAALRAVAGFEAAAPPLATRLAQGRWEGGDVIAEPLAADRKAADGLSVATDRGPGPLSVPEADSLPLGG